MLFFITGDFHIILFIDIIPIFMTPLYSYGSYCTIDIYEEYPISEVEREKHNDIKLNCHNSLKSIRTVYLANNVIL